jgi:chromosome segregation ATPase
MQNRRDDQPDRYNDARHRAPHPRIDEDLLGEVNNVLRAVMASKDESYDHRPARGDLSQRDWAAALEMIDQTYGMLEKGDDRIREAEARARALAQRAIDELKAGEERANNLEGQVRAMEARAYEFETRAKEAEQRAIEAEEWLARMHETLERKFLPQDGEYSQPSGSHLAA